MALNTSLQILFSEPVDRKSVQESIFITPLSAEEVRFQWHGKRLEIRFPSGLLPDRTYVITVGTGAKDRRNNALTTSYSFAFSTGDSLDRGQMCGRLYGEVKTEGVQVWAYDLSITPNPDPAVMAPLYITQANANGDFSLSFIALGKYRIYAVADKNLNRRYDAEREALGVAAKDYQLSYALPKISGIALRIAVRDTTKPRLAELIPTDNTHILLRFTEKMAVTALAQPNNYQIHSDSMELEVKSCHIDFRNSSVVHLLTAPQTAGKTYRLVITNGFDLAMNPLDLSGCNLSFQGASAADITKPYFVASLPQNGANFFSVDSALTLFFSEAMDTLSVIKSLILQDSTKTVVSGSYYWPNRAQVIFKPAKSLMPQMNYTLKAMVDSIFDCAGNRLADTSLVIRFKTMNPDTLSEISGSIVDADSSAVGRFYLTARSGTGAQYQLIQEQNGPFRFVNLMPNSYTIEVFRDADGNGRYSLGQAFPFCPAERYYVYPDTITVRSRWPNEGNDIIFP